MSEAADTSRDETAQQLMAIVLRLESLDEDRAGISAEMRDVRKNAKGSGFDLPTIKRILERRRIEPQAVLEADMLLETYEQALGCGAAAAGMLSATRGADGTFEIRMVAAPEAAEKLTKATRARRDSIALAELARQAREAQ